MQLPPTIAPAPRRPRRAAGVGSAVLLALSWVAWTAGAAAAEPYDPLDVAGRPVPATLDLRVHDATRQRDIPLYVMLPAAPGLAPVILFSPGLGGTPRAYAEYLGGQWSRRGYVSVFLQHPGSDDAVWRGLPPDEVRAALARAANVDNFLLRARDVPAVLDELTTLNAAAANPLSGRLDLAHVGLAGHSFGAVTTQAVSGQHFPMGGTSYTDPRIQAALLLSPSSARIGSNGDAFGAVTVPWLLMTGTRDVSPIGHQSAADRLAVYAALPAGGKYQLVLDGAQHTAFTDRELPDEEDARNPNHHRVIQALSTAFWDAYLRADPAARAWLDGPGPRTVLAPADRWEHK